MSPSLEERFWAKVNKNGPTQPHMDTPCWEWTAAKYDNGYGVMRFMGEHNTGAHRISFYIEHGYMPPVVMHHCDNKCCVNPEHLAHGTHSQNLKDVFARNRRTATRGELAGRAKLTEADVIQMRIRASSGEALSDIAQDFPVSRQTVWKIVARKRWAHVK